MEYKFTEESVHKCLQNNASTCPNIHCGDSGEIQIRRIGNETGGGWSYEVISCTTCGAGWKVKLYPATATELFIPHQDGSGNMEPIPRNSRYATRGVYEVVCIPVEAVKASIANLLTAMREGDIKRKGEVLAAFAHSVGLKVKTILGIQT